VDAPGPGGVRGVGEPHRCASVYTVEPAPARASSNRMTPRGGLELGPRSESIFVRSER
jgi:hypothetical protein